MRKNNKQEIHHKKRNSNIEKTQLKRALKMKKITSSALAIAKVVGAIEILSGREYVIHNDGSWRRVEPKQKIKKGKKG
jgi:hypothetical protein